MLSSLSSGSIRGKDRPLPHPGMRRLPLGCISNVISPLPTLNDQLDDFRAVTKETRNLELVVEMLRGLVQDETKAFDKAAVIVKKLYGVNVVRGKDYSSPDLPRAPRSVSPSVS